MMKIATEKIMKEFIRGSLKGTNKIAEAMKIVPRRKELEIIFKEIKEKYSPYKLALLKICLDLKEAYYKTQKPVFNLKNLLNTLKVQLKVAELLKEG